MKLTTEEWERIRSAKDHVQRCLDRVNPEEAEDHADLLGVVEVLCAAVSECQFLAEELAYAASPLPLDESDLAYEG